MEYTKPVVIAQNNSEQCFAAGCPANNDSSGQIPSFCKECERTT